MNTQTFTQQSSKPNQSRWFNVHTEGLGYLSNIRMIPAQPGQKEFMACDFSMLEGDPSNPSRQHISLSVPSDHAANILEMFKSAADEGVTCFAGVRLAKLCAKPFASDDGELSVRYNARLIKLMYLKVGDQVISLGSKTEKVNGLASSGERPVKDSAPVDEDVVEEAEVETIETQQQGKAHFSPVVELDKKDPKFEITKERLKSAGYRWNPEKAFWFLPEVTLEVNADDFEEKKSWLRHKGYQWDGQKKAWVMPIKKRKH